MNSDAGAAQRCGIIAIVGRPNVGKSTLLNRIVGQKISITSRKPQTTRNRILGITHRGNAQLVFADTPGWQRQPSGKLHKLMNHQIDLALAGIDAVVMVADARGWHAEDARVADYLQTLACPRYLVLNKLDRVERKENLLPLMAELRLGVPFEAVVPISALRGDGVPRLLEVLAAALPRRPHLYPPEQVTDRTERFLAGEIVREKLTRQLGSELPYSINVVIDGFEDTAARTNIDATIWVEKRGQKAIVIGKQGQRLKLVGTEARLDLERLLGRPVFLRTWVKEKGKWTEDPQSLQLFEPLP